MTVGYNIVTLFYDDTGKVNDRMDVDVYEESVSKALKLFESKYLIDENRHYTLMINSPLVKEED
jgi:hypothetical protein